MRQVGCKKPPFDQNGRPRPAFYTLSKSALTRPKKGRTLKKEIKMIFRIYKIPGLIGTGLEKNEGTFVEMETLLNTAGNQISLAVFDNTTNTIHIFNDKIVDVVTLVQKFKNYCNLPDNHQFSILHK